MELQDNHQPKARRETMLTVLLAGLGGGGFLLFLILVSGGFFFFVLLAVAAIAALGFVHYLLWGHGMTLSVEEQQALDLAARQEERDMEMLTNRLRRRH
jgi:hypothetical protein